MRNSDSAYRVLPRVGAYLALLCAALLRLLWLPDLPIGLHYDEAANVILTQEIAQGVSRPVFIGAYTGKEVLFFYLGALWFRVVGSAPWILRLNGAVIGILAVAATYAAARALWRTERYAPWLATFAAAWLALLMPHLILSRYGFRAVSQSLLEALTVAALWRGFRTERFRWLLAGGLFLGLTAYTYLAARLFPIPLALAMVWMLLRSPRQERVRRLLQWALVGAVAAIVFVPLGLYFWQHPEAFGVRIAQVMAPTARDVLDGLGRCVRGLVWPGQGDPGARFNLPGRPVLDPLSGLLALIGLVGILFRRPQDPLTDAGRVLTLAALFVLLLPSALATGDSVPNHMRLVGIYPFLAMLPAWALTRVLSRLPVHIYGRASLAALALLLGGGGLLTGASYFRWARSTEVFYANDGDMVLLARALDTADLQDTTVYIASYHYRHPTVAALSRPYGQARWMTGGATLVLPPQGDALYLIPVTALPPAPWPQELTSRWSEEVVPDPSGRLALWVHRLPAAAVAELRAAQPAADFAHIVQVNGVTPLNACTVGESCVVLVTWEVRAVPDFPLQPVVRLIHPKTGEWSRTHPFHYPVGEWTVGEVVLDQLVLPVPPEAPPVDGYQIAVGFFNPDTLQSIPRVGADEEFAGLEATFPLGALHPSSAFTARGALPPACPVVPETAPETEGVRLVGWSALPATLRPGERLPLTLCWQALAAPLPDYSVEVRLEGRESVSLYKDAPVYGLLPFSRWRAGQVVEDRLSLRIPRALGPGTYTVRLYVGSTPVADLGSLAVASLERDFALPHPTHPLTADFGDEIRLLGYDVGPVQPGQPFAVTLYWQALRETEEDYTVFVHLVDPQTGQIIAQIDEGPMQGAYPTSLWMTGEVIRDAHTLSIPAIPPGTYTLRIGLYIPLTGQRLTVDGAQNVSVPITVNSD